MSHIRLSRALIFAALALAMLLPVSAAARVRVGVGIGVYGAPYYPYYYGPWGYPYYGYYPGYYAPYGYGYYGPYRGYGYGYARPMGELHIKSPEPNAQIFINGAYAGRARDLKTLHLRPGTYNIEQRIGPDIQRERLYVLADRSVTIEFDPPGIPHYHRYDGDYDRD